MLESGAEARVPLSTKTPRNRRPTSSAGGSNSSELQSLTPVDYDAASTQVLDPTRFKLDRWKYVPDHRS